MTVTVVSAAQELYRCLRVNGESRIMREESESS